MPWRMAPMRFSRAQQFRGVDGGRLQGHRHRNSGLHPELQFAVQRGSVEDHRIAGIAAHHQRHAGLPGAQQVGAGGVERALEQLRLGRIGALAGTDELARALEQARGHHLLDQRTIQNVGLAAEVSA